MHTIRARKGETVADTLKKGSRVTGGDRDRLAGDLRKKVRRRCEHPLAGRRDRTVLRLRAPHPDRVGRDLARAWRCHPRSVPKTNLNSPSQGPLDDGRTPTTHGPQAGPRRLGSMLCPIQQVATVPPAGWVSGCRRTLSRSRCQPDRSVRLTGACRGVGTTSSGGCG